jgi:hypothetical protein
MGLCGVMGECVRHLIPLSWTIAAVNGVAPPRAGIGHDVGGGEALGLFNRSSTLIYT